MHSACAHNSGVAGSSPQPVASFLGEPVSNPGPLLALLTLSMIWETGHWQQGAALRDSKGLGWGQREPQAGPQQLLLLA